MHLDLYHDAAFLVSAESSESSQLTNEHLICSASAIEPMTRECIRLHFDMKDLDATSLRRVSEGIDELEQIAQNRRMREAYGCMDRIRIDPSVVRGLEYYTGPVFEAELTFEVKGDDGKPVRFGSVGGGGRYDDLVARFTGTEGSGDRLLDRRVASAGGAVADQCARKLRRSGPSSCSSWIRPRSRAIRR